MKINKNGNLAVELSVVIIVVGWLASISISAFNRVREAAQERAFDKPTYESWVKLTGRTDFTYEEWITARKAGLITVPVINYANTNERRIENE